MKRLVVALGCLALVAGPALAGVVFEIETTDHDSSPPATESSEMSVEGKNLKMGVAAGKRGGRGDAIFRGDRREMVIVDHDDKSYVVMDEKTVEQLAAQVGQASAAIAEALKNVPEEQRAMVEKMMKERMPAAPPAAPKDEVRKTGERAEKNGYPCVKYEVVRGGRTIREHWVTDWSNVEGGDEVMEAFREMADFFQEFMDAIASSAGGALGAGDMRDSIMAQMKEMDGFPVVTREFGVDGGLDSESSLRSSSRRTLDPAEFEPPAGYKRRSMMPGS